MCQQGDKRRDCQHQDVLVAPEVFHEKQYVTQIIDDNQPCIDKSIVNEHVKYHALCSIQILVVVYMHARLLILHGTAETLATSPDWIVKRKYHCHSELSLA